MALAFHGYITSFTYNNHPKMHNPLSADPTKWSNTLKPFVGCCRRFVECV